MPYLHDWIPSTLGHGESMCKRCCMTNREAMALRCFNDCSVPPTRANDNVREPRTGAGSLD